MSMLHSSSFVGEPTLESVADGLDTLTFGRSGEPVRRVQQALIDLGFGPQSGADGIFGQDTAGAVTGFKSARGIAPNDPVVGQGTLIALDIELKAQEDSRPALELIAELNAALADVGAAWEAIQSSGAVSGELQAHLDAARTRLQTAERALEIQFGRP